ncbi:hypothetical protein RND71_032051 [Anisodus tanguticus]|uniref:Protein kinase domain-containing protein n=1 Tax=Anisodus tanguticus TaxID=243964 RepID=A0AAE1RDU3_9SOLA|nr:hypothetical protein RND71_032051 [Anisodus tanguticus]
MVAHLSDFGISKLLSEDDNILYTKTLGTLGYIAPVMESMLIETFTRTKPSDEMFDGDRSLRRWVSNSLPHAVMEVVDANLITAEDNHLMKKLDCVVSIMKWQ